jgi:hypothetical protein
MTLNVYYISDVRRFPFILLITNEEKGRLKKKKEIKI